MNNFSGITLQDIDKTTSQMNERKYPQVLGHTGSICFQRRTEKEAGEATSKFRQITSTLAPRSTAQHYNKDLRASVSFGLKNLEALFNKFYISV